MSVAFSWTVEHRPFILLIKFYSNPQSTSERLMPPISDDIRVAADLLEHTARCASYPLPPPSPRVFHSRELEVNTIISQRDLLALQAALYSFCLHS